MKLNEITESIDKNMARLAAKYTSGDFKCHMQKLKSLEGCPTIVSGEFSCRINDLVSLEHCPTEVASNFNCFYNKLTSLEHSPTIVHGDFICTDNWLKSLEHCPKEVHGAFECSENELTSLEYCPTIVASTFDCSRNELFSLEHCPKEVYGSFLCTSNNLESLEHCPKEVIGNGYFDCQNNKITSLVGIHKHIKSCKKFYFDSGKIVEGGIGLLLIKNLTKISNQNEAFKIIEKYLGQGVKGLPKCQQELIDAGYKEFAKL